MLEDITATYGDTIQMNSTTSWSNLVCRELPEGRNTSTMSATDGDWSYKRLLGRVLVNQLLVTKGGLAQRQLY